MRARRFYFWAGGACGTLVPKLQTFHKWND
jgi:hypothetical protein